ncbi:hypothetical protein ABK249_16155 [Neorhizobium sp. Rsf11]|uniref:DUF7662 domain-containing protein n=1 Tax=Neorhizobium phenanthreniclasticum TaxID=3157917 RepID=A0ABV0M3N4_9HYPH
MGKYEPLGEYLRKQSRTQIPMTFREIERILGRELPASKSHRAWWSNNASNNVMTKQWLAAGYETEAVDIAGEKLVFRKVEDTLPTAKPDHEISDEDLPDHPIFGCMEGTITIMPGADLTEPMDFEWGEKLYNE